jgi:hypothetical protein
MLCARPALVLTLACASRCHGYVAGAVCDDTDMFGPVNGMLQGRHLTILEYEWPGFAAKGGEKTLNNPHGFFGFDIDLIEKIADILGFAYTIQQLEPLNEDESWEAMLMRTVDSADLILSYWTRTQSRINAMCMLAPHIEYSPVMVVQLEIPQVGSDVISISLHKLLSPFSYSLWGVIILIIAASGVIDYVLERREGGTLSWSVYEYFAGVLWGGFLEPRSQPSAVYQVTLGVFFLVVVASYTANLAAFLTLQAVPEVKYSSIGDLLRNNVAACIRDDDPRMGDYRRMYPGLKLVGKKIDDLGPSVVGGTCMAAILPKTNFDVMKMEPEFCSLTLTPQGSLSFIGAGWITNVNSSVCVQRPIEYAPYPQRARRRAPRQPSLSLSAPAPHMSPAHVDCTPGASWARASPDCCRDATRAVRCRWALEQLVVSGDLQALQTQWVAPSECVHHGLGNTSANGADGALVPEDASKLSLWDMAFLYALWGSVTIVVVAWRVVQVIDARRKSGEPLLPYKEHGLLYALFGDCRPPRSANEKRLNVSGLHQAAGTGEHQQRVGSSAVDADDDDDVLLGGMARRIELLQSDLAKLQNKARKQPNLDGRGASKLSSPVAV